MTVTHALGVGLSAAVLALALFGCADASDDTLAIRQASCIDAGGETPSDVYFDVSWVEGTDFWAVSRSGWVLSNTGESWAAHQVFGDGALVADAWHISGQSAWLVGTNGQVFERAAGAWKAHEGVMTGRCQCHLGLRGRFRLARRLRWRALSLGWPRLDATSRGRGHRIPRCLGQ